MNLLQIFMFILISVVISIEGKPNQCCSNNKPILRNGLCENNDTLLIKQFCDKFYALDLNETLITENDELFIKQSATTIPKNRYCEGKIYNSPIILTCFDEVSNSDYVPSSNKIAMITCMIVSIICLLLTIIVYSILPRLRDLLGKCIMCTIFCLLLAFLALSAAHLHTAYSYSACYFIAISIYFWFLGSFFWMNILAFHIWRSLANPSYPRNSNRVFKYYNIYGWGTPVFILLIAKLAYHIPGDHIKPTWTVSTCWFSDYKSTIIYFYIPSAILLTSNIIIFILSAWELRKQTNMAVNNKLRSRKYKFLLCLKLFLTMGLCWIFEPISFVFEYHYLANIWFISDILNALQGLIIFLLLVVFRKRVRRDLARHKGICCKKLPQDWAAIADDNCEELSDEEEKMNEQNES